MAKSTGPRLPTKPTYTFRGEKMSGEFGAGVSAMREALRSFKLPTEATSTNIDERAGTETLVALFEPILAAEGDARVGALAALAHYMIRWAAEFTEGDMPGDWAPLAYYPSQRENDGREGWLLPADVRCFDVDGEPVWVSPELGAVQWIGSGTGIGPFEFSLDIVRKRGSEISRDEFKAMCGGIFVEEVSHG